ncbi:MAG TPA: sugar ABC transporter ATP-binding protein, partial [Anaerolineae bacterium]|nr:sugar ABC transporter ATP-binding protein [Anaerolineae bacterium]
QQQMVEIAKALSLNADIIIMDEPSASLGGSELEHLFDIIATLRSNGVTVIYISHRIEEIFEIAQRVTVLKDGQLVDTCAVEDTDRAALIRMMVGRTLSEAFPPRSSEIGQEVLSVAGLTCGGKLEDINLKVHRGEIVGLAGLVGAGRTDLAKAIFGALPLDQGEIAIKGQRMRIANPKDAMDHSIGFLTEDRKEEGLVLGMSLRHNAALPSLDNRKRFGLVEERKEGQVVQEMIQRLDLRAASLDQEVQYLSGGNQQKAVLAKWLISGPELLIFDEPTRGIDVGAKTEIWHLMRQLAEHGAAILMISSELSEIIGMSDRVVVMCEGRIAGELPGDGAAGIPSEEQIMMLATGGKLSLP